MKEKELKYNIIPTTPEKKNYTEVKKFDVARIEYGDFDCFVDAIILDIKAEPSKSGNPNSKTLEITFATKYGSVNVGYEFVYNDKCMFEIIGKAEEIKKINEEELAPTL